MSLLHDGVGSTRELVAWATYVVTLDVHDVGSFLSDAVALLRNVTEPTTYSWFKRQLRDRYPFTGAFLAPIREGLSSFLEDPNPRGFYLCNQFLSFLTHLTLLDIDVDMEGEYEEMERYLQSIPYNRQTLVEMNSIMKGWMSGFRVSEDNFLPAHGPGAVAEQSASSGQLSKYQYLGTDAMLEYVFRKHAGVDVSSYFPFSPKGLNRKSKLVVVPKSIKTRRTISKEPATLQYLQQGIARILMDLVHEHPYLRQRINLRDQEKNALLAIKSSGDGQYSTIDLSSASDTVTDTLVKAVFHGTPALPFLVALRSRTVVLPSGKEIRVAKFAPMGSALCFPVETLIFACAVELAVRRRSFWDDQYLASYRVYGDDIIVMTPIFGDVVGILEELGFITNSSKSFTSPTRFRESCGGEGYDGRAVSPMKISRRYQAVEKRLTAYHAPLYEGIVDMANSCHEYGFSLTRAWLVRVLLDNHVAPPLFSEDGHGAIASPKPDNFRAEWRFNKRLFRRECKVAVSRTPQVEPVVTPDLEQARYFETLRITSDRDGDMFRPEHRSKVPWGSPRPKIMKTFVDPLRPPAPRKRYGKADWVAKRSENHKTVRLHLLGDVDRIVTITTYEGDLTDFLED
jgi:hypothetical protein